MDDPDQLIATFRDAFKAEHVDLARHILQASPTLFYPDLLILAAMKRSLSLLRGFADLVATRNYVAAAPFIRLQLDNALRASALALAADPHAVAVATAAGDRIDKMYDRNGKRLTDRHLRETLSEQWPWISQLYAQSSGHIHLSQQHILMTFKGADGRPSSEFSISDQSELVPNDVYVSAVHAIASATFVFLRYVEAWLREKRRVAEDESAGKCIHKQTP